MNNNTKAPFQETRFFKLICYFFDGNVRTFYSFKQDDKKGKDFAETKMKQLGMRYAPNASCIILYDNQTRAELQRWQNGEIIYS